MTAAANGRLPLRVRERRPDLPNFRNFGLTVERDLLRLLGSLQRAHGYGFASETTLRAMMFQDTGHLPGVGTLHAALRRLELNGVVEVRWIHRGSQTPDGAIARVGTLRTRVAVNRRERFDIARRARHVNRREGVGACRRNYANPMDKLALPAPAPLPSEDGAQRDFDRKRAESIRRLHEWATREGVT